jgi:signal transduction histidine kinase
MRSLGYLVSQMTHDMKNMLSVLGANTDLLATAGLDAETTEKVLGTNRRMVSDAFDLLDGVFRLAPDLIEPQKVDLTDAVERLGSAVADVAPDGVEVTVTTRGQQILGQIDQAQFDQVLLNLGVNALDAVAGEGRVEFAMHPVVIGEASNDAALTPGRYCELSVRDDGPGIAAHLLNTLFEPFVTTKPPSLGTGLGLATSLDTISRAGGAIIAENDPRGGAVFTVWVPLWNDDTEQSTTDDFDPADAEVADLN